MPQPHPDKTDEALLASIQAGDPNALEELYQRYSKRLLRYFYRMLGNDEPKSQDFLHDLFVKVLEKSSQFDGHRFSTWLFSIAHNMCKNEYRRLQVRRSGHMTEREYFLPMDIDLRAFRESLANQVTQLDDDKRQLYLLRYEMELPIDEIAEIINCPAGTVKSRLFFLKKELSMKLKAYKSLIG